MKLETPLLAALAGLALLATPASAQVTFEVIDGDVVTCNVDGSIILGVDATDYFLLENGVKTYIPGSLWCADLSDDGSVVYGMVASSTGGLDTAAIYTVATNTWVELGGLPGENSPANEDSTPYQISGDGLTAVGLGWRTDFTAAGFRYRAGTGVVELPQMGPSSSRASAVSGDGHVIGGWDADEFGTWRASIWDENLNQTLLLDGVTTDGIGQVNGLNSDGSVVCGAAGQEGFVWTAANGPTLFGPFGFYDSNRAFATSEDGEVVVGNATTFPFDRAATIWTPAGGNQSLQEVLLANGVTGLDNIVLEGVSGISADGTILVGWGFDFVNGFIGWKVVLPRCGDSENFCTSTPNSTGSPAVIGSNGMHSIGANGLALTAGPVPNDFGLFFFSLGMDNQSLGNGTLCIGGADPFFRLDPQMAVGNEHDVTVDLTGLPTGAPTPVAGATWHFQCWFRDPAAGGANFDLSDGLSITWCD